VLIECLSIFLPRCGQWVASVAKAQAPMWVTWLRNGHYDLKDYACYLDALGDIARCGLS
jgi:hypothetical protein